MSLFNLDGKVALVTGGSRGIGAGCAEVLGMMGARVAVNYRRNQAAAEAVVASIRAGGSEAVRLQADVSVPEKARELVHRTIEHFGQLDILVNNAGHNAAPPLVFDMTPDEATARWDWIIATNLASQFQTTYTAVPRMIERRWGRVINISSISGVRGGLIGDVEYSASKAGILGLTRGLARYVAPHNITVNALAVGLVKTDMLLDGVAPERLKRLVKTIPLGRLGEKEDIGHLVGFLATEEAGWITGETIQINGGQHIA